MDIGTVTVRTRVQYRDKFGRFARMLDEAAIAAARELTDKAVELAKQNHAPHSRTDRLMSGIRPRYAGKVGYVESTAPHAHPVEAGAIAHQIPGSFGRDGSVLHPGNDPAPYLAQVPGQLQAYAPGIVAKHYP